MTVRQIANRAGVSIGTVSRALNNKPGISEETRQLVFSVAQELGYTPPRNIPLPSLAVSHLGILFRPFPETLLANPFYADVLFGVEQICNQYHINISLNTLDYTGNTLRTRPTLINDERIRGVVLLGAIPQTIINSIFDSTNIPFVLVDNDFKCCRWDSVMVDNRDGLRKATEHLINYGHQNIAFISGPDHPSIVERREAHEQVMREHNLKPYIITMPELGTAEGGMAVSQVLDEAPQTTAFLFSNDSQAVGGLKKLQAFGFRVPEDFSLVGFDNITLTQFSTPPITTIHVDRIALGQLATHLLLGRIIHPDRPAVHTTLGVYLVDRASVAPPRTHPIPSIRR